jgi:hypothetical protein
MTTNTTSELDEVTTYLQGMFGSLMGLSACATVFMERNEPEMHRKIISLVQTGAGHLEARILTDPPLVILSIRTDEETAIEFARLRVPDLPAMH